MPSWRMAKGLDKLLAEINLHYPSRSKASDGGVGDAAHAARASDHNPDERGIVHARDFTHDPGVFDAHAFAERLRASGDERVKYIISSGRIAFGAGSWEKYTGTNQHDKHVHVSITIAGEDDESSWVAVPDKENAVAHATSPFKGRYTQKHGHSGGYAGHKGIDIAPPSPGQTGQPVYAMFAGTVVRVARNVKPGNRLSTWAPGRTGNGLLIRNPDGEGNGYNHVQVLDSVKAGSTIKVGQLLGYNDRSGNQTAPHLHFEMWSSWKNSNSDYDPAPAFKRWGIAIGGAPKPAGTTAPKPQPQPSKPQPSKPQPSKPAQKPAAKPKPKPKPKDWPHADTTVAKRTKAWDKLMGDLKYTGGSTLRRQKWLTTKGYYKGKLDNKWGPMTTKALQRILADRGFYHGRIDGKVGPVLKAAEVAFLNDQRKYY